MDFVERWFGAAPDGGTGALELVVLAAAMVAVFFLTYRRSATTAASR
jgi:hypothetical protein